MMVTMVEPDAAAVTRFRILPCGVRVVRLGPADGGWLVEYQKILRIACQDFLKRGHIPGTPEGVLADLASALAEPARAVWLALRPDYSFLGFALAEVSASFGGPPSVVAVATYLYPRRTPRAVFPALVEAMLAWGASQGASVGYFHTRRTESRAWARIQAQPVATVYAIQMRAAPAAEEDSDG